MMTTLARTLGLVAIVAGSLHAGAFSFTGTFSSDDQVQEFIFIIASPGTVTFQSYGYGGGTNAASAVIPAGGFDSLFSWFAPDGSLIGVNDDGCGAAGSNHGNCLDAFASPFLGAAGAYTLALTQSGNGSLGSGFPGDLALGFQQQGQGNYTASGGCPQFCDTFGNQNNGNWAVDISGVSSATALTSVPEAGNPVLTAIGLSILALERRRRSA
jgi:hypothetical protein